MGADPLLNGLKDVKGEWSVGPWQEKSNTKLKSWSENTSDWDTSGNTSATVSSPGKGVFCTGNDILCPSTASRHMTEGEACTINIGQRSDKDISGSLPDNGFEGEGPPEAGPSSFVIGECVPEGPLSSSSMGLLIVWTHFGRGFFFICNTISDAFDVDRQGKLPLEWHLPVLPPFWEALYSRLGSHKIV